jgi:hypothetical protein
MNYLPWKTAIAGNMLILFSLFSCATATISDVKTGWINSDTYRIMGVGDPSKRARKRAKKISKIKQISKGMALGDAQYKVIEGFEVIWTKAGNICFEVPSHFKSIIRAGRIVRIEYDSNHRCKLIYEVKSAYLKNRIINFKVISYITRSIDIEYQRNPAKRKNDINVLREHVNTIETVFKKAEADYKAKKTKRAITGFISVADKAIKILYLYEALGYSFKNSKFKNPNHLIFRLEIYLEERKDIKMNDGSILNEITNPKGKEILLYANRDTDNINLSKIDAEVFYSSAKRIMGYIKDKILSKRELIDQ